MPIYCYRDREGEIHEMEFRMGEAPEEISIGYCDEGETAVRDYSAEARGMVVFVKGSSNPVKRAWPMPPCVGSGVHASDGPKLAKFLKDRGCPTQVVDGDPIYTSAAHRRKALKVRGLVDKSSFS